jgi:hypothetical protein
MIAHTGIPIASPVLLDVRPLPVRIGSFTQNGRLALLAIFVCRPPALAPLQSQEHQQDDYDNEDDDQRDAHPGLLGDSLFGSA